jgi:hypothetical protein
MANLPSAAIHLQLIHSNPELSKTPSSLSKLMNLFGISDLSDSNWVENLPFAGEDTTAGSETELQTVVIGPRDKVDLPLSIEQSNYFRNMAKRAATGDAPGQKLDALEAYLSAPEEVWENSWVRFPLLILNEFARSVLESDMRADKSKPISPQRCDARRFICSGRGDKILRIPASYMLKIALADAIGQPDLPAIIKSTGRKMMAHFLNDNTSPETHSFHPVRQNKGMRVGSALAVETLMRYLLTQLLVQYANRQFKLESFGQQVIVYFAPHAPVRQKAINELISDTFYRELYMSPCLSGWDRGEDKHQYMALCHEVLSRSQLNALGKLKEAGVIANNLVVLPNTSNISLANNGTHISIGSRTLTRLMGDPHSGYGDVDEKYYGDLVVKVTEHFLPLFVGTYSAAPYRLDFWDFHPERALGFLPHELDYTHLRMLWRRWKGKAGIKFLGHPLTPFGPEWLDRTISSLLRLKGDFIVDFRLLDYLAALLSTDESPALDGQLGNDVRLRSDLQDMGVFHSSMPLYLLCRLRHYRNMGFSGYEARYFSLFEHLADDMGAATDLQVLITMLAYKYVLEGKVSHRSIPDSPTVESERRQFFFGSAIGIPTFYVHKNSANRFLVDIVQGARHTRHSRRYRNYVRIPRIEYHRALIRLLRKDAGDLIDLLQLNATIDNLEQRVNHPEEHAVANRLTHQILKGKRCDDPLKMSGGAFNREAESYYRQGLRRRHLKEAFAYFIKAVKHLDSWRSWRSGQYNQALLTILGGRNADEYLAGIERRFYEEDLSAEESKRLIYLLLLVLHQGKLDMETAEAVG